MWAKEAKALMVDALWKQNAGLVQILGICPALAVSTNIVNGVSLGLATSLVMFFSGLIIAIVRGFIPRELRNPLFIFVIATLVTVIDLMMNAYLHRLYVILGIFIPLIVTNCIVLARAEVFASKNGMIKSGLDGLFMGIGLTLVLAVLGGLRELIGKGTLLSGIDLIFGPTAQNSVIYLIPSHYQYQFLVAILPPGAFLGLALLIALHAWIQQKRQTSTRLP